MDFRSKLSLLQAYAVTRITFLNAKRLFFQLKAPKGHFVTSLCLYIKTNGSIKFLDPKNLGMEPKMRFLGQLLAELWSNPSFSYGCAAAILKIEICGMKMSTD